MISEYLKKYSYYYLTRYSVTKRKFENILKRKISKDYFQKKISAEEKNQYINEIPQIIDHHIKNGSLIKKGYSLKKIKITLIKLCFNKEILDTTMSNLYLNESLNYDLMENFFNRSKILTNSNLSLKKNDFKKMLNKFVNMGFDHNRSLTFLKKKLNFYDYP